MKKTATLLLLAAAFGLHAQSKKVLFIGNSYVATNNLPQLLHNIALANGDSITFDSHTPGGYTLQMHSQDQNTITKIYSQQWDYVVIQAQSQEPSFDTGYVAANVMPYAHKLDSMVRDNNSCSQTVFMMTWGRKNGDASNCVAYPPVCTYAGMQGELRRRYLAMAYVNNTMVCPAGLAWREVIATNPAFDLYSSDGSHPSLHGSYLTACTFYSSLYRRVTGGGYYAGLPQAEAQLLQAEASAIVLDSIDVWNTEVYYPQPAYTVSGNGLTVTFNNASTNSTSWQVDASGVLTQPSFTYTYPGPGAYPFTFVASNNCLSDTIRDTVIVPLFTGLPEYGAAAAVTVSPNPSAGNFELQFTTPGTYAVTVFDVRGQIVQTQSFRGSRMPLDLHHADAGVYMVRISSSDGQLFRTRLIKQ